MYKGVKEVKALPEYKLLLSFENGERRVFDVSPYPDHGIFQALRDPTVFNSAHISSDTVAWANGAAWCPEVLYEEVCRVGSQPTRDVRKLRPRTPGIYRFTPMA